MPKLTSKSENINHMLTDSGNCLEMPLRLKDRAIQLAVQGGTGPVELDKVRKGKTGQNQGDNRVELTQFKGKTGQTRVQMGCKE